MRSNATCLRLVVNVSDENKYRDKHVIVYNSAVPYSSKPNNHRRDSECSLLGGVPCSVDPTLFLALLPSSGIIVAPGSLFQIVWTSYLTSGFYLSLKATPWRLLPILVLYSVTTCMGYFIWHWSLMNFPENCSSEDSCKHRTWVLLRYIISPFILPNNHLLFSELLPCILITLNYWSVCWIWSIASKILTDIVY